MGRDEQLPTRDDAEGAGVCVHAADSFIMTDRQSIARKCELHVTERGKPAALPDDQQVPWG